ncbi:hypothetical protein BC829DRAFT_489001, partial [Chytridium lagenaria]
YFPTLSPAKNHLKSALTPHTSHHITSLHKKKNDSHERRYLHNQHPLCRYRVPQDSQICSTQTLKTLNTVAGRNRTQETSEKGRAVNQVHRLECCKRWPSTIG